MDKEQFIEVIKKEINNGERLLAKFKALRPLRNNFGDGMAVLITLPRTQYSHEECNSLTKDLVIWERRVNDILKCYFGDKKESPSQDFKMSETNKWLDFKKSGMRCIMNNITTLSSYLDRIEYLKPANDALCADSENESQEKPYKVFISHAGEDYEFVSKLVKLLEYLGVKSKDKLLCSSIKGYRFPLL